MKVNEPDSLVCWFERVMVRVSPLATAASVALGSRHRAVHAAPAPVAWGRSKAAVNAATATCAAAPPRLTRLLRLKPANNPSFPNTSRPAAKPADCAYRCPTLKLLPDSPADHRDLPNACPGAPCSHCDARVTVKAKSDLFRV